MIRVRNSSGRFIARSFSLGPYKRVTFGQLFEVLGKDEQLAVLYHEMAHCEMHHTEWRILFLLLLPFLLGRLCRNQELQADQFAAECGHAAGMIKVLEGECEGGFLYPSHGMRRGYLKIYEHNKPRFVPVTDSSPGLA